MTVKEDFAFVLLYLGAFGLSDYVILKKFNLFSKKRLFLYYTILFIVALSLLSLLNYDNIFYHLSFILIYIVAFGFSDLLKLKLSETFYTLYYMCLFFAGLVIVLNCS